MGPRPGGPDLSRLVSSTPSRLLRFTLLAPLEILEPLIPRRISLFSWLIWNDIPRLWRSEAIDPLVLIIFCFIFQLTIPHMDVTIVHASS